MSDKITKAQCVEFVQLFGNLVKNNGGVVPTKILEMLNTWIETGKLRRTEFSISIGSSDVKVANDSDTVRLCPYVKKNKDAKGEVCNKKIRKKGNEYCSRHNAYIKSLNR